MMTLMTSAAAGHDAKGQQWGLKAKTTRMPQAPRTWIRTEDRRQPRIIGVPRTWQTAMPENTAAEPTAGRSSKRLPETSISLPGITLSDEGGRAERTRSRRRGRRHPGVHPLGHTDMADLCQWALIARQR